MLWPVIFLHVPRIYSFWLSSRLSLFCKYREENYGNDNNLLHHPSYSEFIFWKYTLCENTKIKNNTKYAVGVYVYCIGTVQCTIMMPLETSKNHKSLITFFRPSAHTRYTAIYFYLYWPYHANSEREVITRHSKITNSC